MSLNDFNNLFNLFENDESNMKKDISKELKDESYCEYCDDLSIKSIRGEMICI